MLLLVPYGCSAAIIPRARMGSESISHEVDGRMSYRLTVPDSEPIRARGIYNCFSKIQIVGQRYRDKTTLASKTRSIQPPLFWFSKPTLFAAGEL